MHYISGNPRVGNMLTIEAVAEHHRNPMYSVKDMSYISMKHDFLTYLDIYRRTPTDVGKLESQLSKIFQIAKYWYTMLLLDEQRS